MNLRFIKPSHKFYNEIMSHWFKFLFLLEEKREDLSHQSQKQPQWVANEITKSFVDFSRSQLLKNGTWGEQVILKPLEKFAEIIVQEYCQLKNHQSSEDDPISMISFFDQVKSQLMKRWEKDIIQKSSYF